MSFNTSNSHIINNLCYKEYKYSAIKKKTTPLMIKINHF